ncbi:hypothetical protein D9758_008791 [Tetrapyrgos nigripes]|uniref:Uncharacterized protein n=1 Tax=Tetrapyrgos nigripes TaxID=182062 RepID=A0A8H5FY57_9AGAR|nr:hypothetical protein D9758_008791 [Tetrapyrgos nigripes]
MSSTTSLSTPTSISDSSDASSLVQDGVAAVPEGNQAVGLASAKLAQGRRRMLDVVNRLQMTGVQVDIDLPQIAVVGIQSAGKSSLIESISGITLPRASGTCTRCPMECNLSYSDKPWKCVVSLRSITDASGQPLGEPRNEPFGPVIVDKSEVEDRIRRAQKAILHPRLPMSQFLEGDVDEAVDGPNATKFSSNCVSLKISGPDVADLSFCDLPGLIRTSSGDGSAGDVDLVEKLVESYIKKPSCIILLAVSCETDFQNQGALQLAKKFDPKGERTVGVLTKPDRIPTGDEALWVRFIKNDVPGYILNNNWYSVKQPNTTELLGGITWAQARANENNFFSMTPPWSDLEPMYRRYLRTVNLVDRLSSILSDLISKRLPEIHSELQASIKKTRSELQTLPKAPSRDPLNEITTLLVRFTTDLSKHLEGVPDSDGLLQKIRPAQEVFRKSIRKSAPNFKPFEKKMSKTYRLQQFPFLKNENEADDDEEGVDDTDESVSAVAEAYEAYSPVARRADIEETKTYYPEATEYSSVPRPKYSPVSLQECCPAAPEADYRSDQYMPEKNTIYIDEVLKRAHEARTRELPGNYPHVVQEHYINQFTRNWSEPAKALCDLVHKLVSEYVFQMIHSHFNDFGQGLLERQIRVIMQEHLKSRLEATLSRIDWLVELESRPFTLNTHYLSDYHDKFLAHYKDARHRVTVTTPCSSLQVSQVLAGLAQMGYPGMKESDLPRLLSDPMEPALTIMADVRAYFQVAYKRFTDNIPLAIDHELVRGLEKDIFDTLTSQLRIYSESEGLQICQELAQESPQVSGRREELTNKLERMQGASRELAKF